MSPPYRGADDQLWGWKIPPGGWPQKKVFSNAVVRERHEGAGRRSGQVSFGRGGGLPETNHQEAAHPVIFIAPLARIADRGDGSGEGTPEKKWVPVK